MLWIAGYLQVFLVFFRFIFNFLNFVPAAVCLYYSTPTENCIFRNQSHNILGSQEVSNTVNTIGALLEDANSLLLVFAVFSWKLFKVRRYFKAVLRVGHFWVWCFFCVTFSLSILYVDIVHGTDNTGKINVNAVALITEMFLLTLLASAVNFIAHDTYVNWVEDRFWGQLTARVFKPLFRMVLCAYFFRNLGLFLYDTALVSMSISLLKRGKVEGSRDWDSLLLLLSAAFRGSFTKFFFEKMFQGQQLPPVCEKEAVDTLLGPELQRERFGGYQRIDASSEYSLT
ncbi:hypothetical protein ACROYT_G028173 [Oculina patagonica]